MERLLNLDRRLIFLLLAAALVVVCLWPFKQPIQPSQLVRNIHDKIDTLPARSVILISADFDPQARAELHPMTLALLRHCFQKDHRVIGMTFWVEGAQMAKSLFDEAAKELGKNAGEDYTFLGYKPGGMAAIITNLGENIQTTFEKDLEGRPTEGMKALEGVTSLKNVDLLIDIAAGSTVEPWVIYGGDKYGVPVGAGCTGVMGPDMYPFVHSKQLIGLIGGLRGVADYETLMGKPGAGVSGMPAQSAAHALIILLVVLGNVLYFLSRRQGRTGGST